jgi:hypothetical protein
VSRLVTVLRADLAGPFAIRARSIELTMCNNSKEPIVLSTRSPHRLHPSQRL